MEITNKIYGTPQYKSATIHNWKRVGIIHDNFDSLFEEYLNTTSCQHCGKDFVSTKDRCIDHNHETGEVRLIVCQKCNAGDSYIKYPDGYDPKKYYQQNKEKIAEQHAEYRQLNKEKIAEQLAEYRRQNKEKLAEYQAEYRQQNKEKIAEQRAEKLKCECGDFVYRGGLTRHRKTQKHQTNIKSLGSANL